MIRTLVGLPRSGHEQRRQRELLAQAEEQRRIVAEKRKMRRQDLAVLMPESPHHWPEVRPPEPFFLTVKEPLVDHFRAIKRAEARKRQ